MYVQVSAADQVKNIINEMGCSSWNVIIGSYVEKQKVVFQCFSDEKVSEPALYIKVGGGAAEQEMKTETEYLRNPIQSNLFYSPKVLRSQARAEGYPFNIQVTEEFSGSKMNPELNQDIYQIFRDIANSKPPVFDDGIEKVFSHGDFTPWNIKKDDKQYVVFDWEYSGYRFYGFDIIHYLWQIENKLNKCSEEIAFIRAYQMAAKMDNQIAKMSQEDLKNQYFCELEKHFGNVH